MASKRSSVAPTASVDMKALTEMITIMTQENSKIHQLMTELDGKMKEIMTTFQKAKDILPRLLMAADQKVGPSSGGLDIQSVVSKLQASESEFKQIIDQLTSNNSKLEGLNADIASTNEFFLNKDYAQVMENVQRINPGLGSVGQMLAENKSKLDLLGEEVNKILEHMIAADKSAPKIAELSPETLNESIAELNQQNHEAQIKMNSLKDKVRLVGSNFQKANGIVTKRKEAAARRPSISFAAPEVSDLMPKMQAKEEELKRLVSQISNITGKLNNLNQEISRIEAPGNKQDPKAMAKKVQEITPEIKLCNQQLTDCLAKLDTLNYEVNDILNVLSKEHVA